MIDVPQPSEDDLKMVLYQIHASRTNEAINQCQECGSYRLDAKPPILHASWCASYGDLLHKL